ncbi:Putative protein of unknown function with bromo domain [Podospora comata]|uniref:Bromodomain-containing factor 1 n=1 Tax=Podospora comata TaxID=48703 RepID=A0ABY6S8N2_PODCO|nr:Putative protein of unknown function with bromo domain [Podospora comata]
MAVMATQQSEGTVVGEKPVASSLELEKDARNGGAEVNGHTSPEAPNHTEKDETDSKQSHNQEAFSTNSALKSESADASDKPIPDVPTDAKEALKDAEPVKMDVATPPDTEMPDAPPSPAAEVKQAETQIELPAEVAPDTQSAAPSKEDQPAKAPTPDALITSDAKNEAPTKAMSTSVSPMTKTRPTPPATDKEEDVVMADAQVTAESTQETPVFATVPDVKPSIEKDPAPASPSKASPPPSATADTSMSDLAASAKVSRERDIDSEDEPVAKRTKVDHSIEAKNNVNPQDRMDVDRQSAPRATPAQAANGRPKYLNDDSLNDNPITDWQNRQIRQVLAGVKKTKVGGNFRQSVQHLWPMLWPDYSARIANPIDISAMERRLRGDGQSYKNLGEFKRDLNLLVENAVSFNGEAHEVTVQAKGCRSAILDRLSKVPATEPARPDKKDSIKHHNIRHAEPRSAVHQSSTATPRPPKPAAPAPKPAVENPAFAIPPGNNGMPLIRRDSTKVDSRAKRPVKPPQPRDVFTDKRKKKLPPELRFCDEVLTELRKTKYYDCNGAFLQPVDVVALQIPTYYKVVKKPMDLSTMANKLHSGEYASAKDVERDFDLIVKNAKAFNGDDHPVTIAGYKLQSLFRAEMNRKDEWLARNAPPEVINTASPRIKDESDDEPSDTEPEPEQSEEITKAQTKITSIQKRLDDEQKKLSEMINTGSASEEDVDISHSIISTLQKQLIRERNNLKELTAAVKPAKPNKPAKSKKTHQHLGGVTKKAAAAGGAGGGGHHAAGAVKKGPKRPPPKKKISEAEKAVITEHLSELDGVPLERAIELIKRDTGQGENESGELELDIEQVSEEALVRLYEIIIKAHPHLKVEREKKVVDKTWGQAADHHHSNSNAKSKSGAASAASKSKKNKPMSKSEQERRIQQLNELRAQANRNQSGSQEPMESIEGTGRASAEPPTAVNADSEDEVDSEED